MADTPWEAVAAANALTPAPEGPWTVLQAERTLTEPRPDAPRGLLHAVQAGYEQSGVGLGIRGKLPEHQLAADAAWYERATASLSSLVSDLPLMVVGGAAGLPLGGPIGAAAGGFAAPMVVRGALMKAYEQGGVNSFEQAWEVTKAGAVEGVKGAVLGAVTAGTGRLAQVGAAAAGMGTVAKIATVAGAETTALATTGAALEGHLPTAQEFLDAAILVGGLHAAVGIVGGMRNTYAKTGVKPDVLAAMAVKDPAVKDALAAGEVPDALKPLAAAENAKAAIPLKEDGKPLPSDTGPSPFTVGADKLGEKIPVPKIDPTVIETFGDLQGAVGRLETVYEKQIAEQTRTPVSHKQSYAEAQQILANTLGVLPDRLPGEAITVPGVLSRAAVADSLATDLVKSAREVIAKGDAMSEVDIAHVLAKAERAGMGHSFFMGARAESGRILNILATVKKTTTQLEMIRQAVDDYGGTGNARDFIKAIADADSSAAALKAAKQFTAPTLMEKALEVWKAAGLSGPTTHLANISGNFIGLMVELSETYQAAMIGKLARNPERVRFEEGAARLSGIAGGTRDALLLAKEGLLGNVAATGKLDQPRGAIGGKVGEAVRIPFKALTAEDLFFRTLAERGEANALATRDALQQGLVPGTKEYNSKIVDILQNPDEARMSAIKDAGDLATYTKELGKMGKHLQLMVRGTPLEFILPYIRTPANLLKWAAERIPGVNLLMSKVRDDLAAGGVRRDMALARMVTGSVVLSVAMAAQQKGILTGGGLDKTPEERATMRAAGWQPYSVKLDGEWHSYARLDPLGRLFSTMTDLTEITSATESGKKMDVLGVGVAAIGNATISQTYLQGLGSMVGALTDPQRYGQRWVDQYASSLVPAAIGQVAAAKDPHEREINGILDAIQSRIPIWREQLLPQRNPLTGEPVKSSRDLTPIRTTEASTDPVLTEAVRLGIGLTSAPKTIHVGKGTGKIGNVEITPEARNAFVSEQGRFAHEILTTLVGGPFWNAMPDIQKAKVYDRVLKAARMNAAMVALPPDQRIEAAVKISQEVTNQMFAEPKQ